ncbi:MAG: TatD family hydrolase [Litorivicinaceae bacterium]
MIDSHCHLDCIDGADQPARVQELLDRAAAHGVHGMLCISITLGNAAPRHLAASYDPVWATVGIHPCHADEEPAVSVDQLCTLAAAPKVIALGETGLDGYHQPVTDLQRASFIAHLQAGDTLGLPIVVHTREAREETIALIAQYGSASQTGVLHCFTETWEMAKAALDLGYYISMSGIVSFPKATNVHEVCRKIPADRLLIETDAPWLAPVPYRGKTNEPAFVSHVAEAVARLRGTAVETIAEQTTENFERLFGVGRR